MLAHRRLWPQAALALICVVAGALAVWQATLDSVTIDEPVYVSAGVTALTRDDLRLNPQHPPLAKILAALPVLASDPALPYGPGWRRGSARAFAATFYDRARRDGKLSDVTTLSRLVPVLELMLSGLLVYALAARLAGPPGGVFSAALWLLNPFVIGIGHLDGIDLPFALATLVSVLALVRWLEDRTTARAMELGLACGAALLVRYTGPLVLAVAVATVAWAGRRWRPPVIVAAVALAVLWLFYAAFDPGYTFSHLNVVPQRYADGVRLLVAAHAGPQDAFLLGHHWKGVRWWFWPANWLIKLPITLLAAYAIVPFVLRGIPRERWRPVYVAVMPTAVVLALFTIVTPDDRGLRYMLAVIALFTVGVAPLVLTRRWLPLVLVAGSILFVAESLPHPFSWTAPPFRPGYEMAADSNLDWGQDMHDVQRWARGKSPWIACYSPKGSGCVEDVPGAKHLLKHTPQAQVHGLVAISSTLLNQDDWHPWLRHERRIGTVDGTTLLYRVP
jgi:hypothetical protein